MLSEYRQIMAALYRLYQNSGFAMAGAVAFSFIVSLFPFSVFLGAIAGVFGGRQLAAQAIEQMFAVLPKSVGEVLAPQIEQIMGESRVGLLTLSGLLALFFATSANETLRAALNGAYRITEERPYLLCLSISALFLTLTALSMLVLAWVLVVGPNLVPVLKIPLLTSLFEADWFSTFLRYAFAGVVLAVYLLGVHLYLAAGNRKLREVWPGVLLTIFLMLALAALYSRYLAFSTYTQFYEGPTQVMVALIFFQVTGIAILLGAELNRGIIELSRLDLTPTPA
jgi:membrane protein